MRYTSMCTNWPKSWTWEAYSQGRFYYLHMTVYMIFDKRMEIRFDKKKLKMSQFCVEFILKDAEKTESIFYF